MNQSATEADASQVGPVSTVDDKPTGYQRGSTRSWIAVAGGLIGAFMAILDIQITNASMKEIQGSLGA
ncbi:EmrB/QacA family drug resistance transporter, partial [Shewanella sp. 11B5]